MHEFSIASALLDLVRDYVPQGGILRAVKVEAGPKRGIDPEAMQWAWQAAVSETPWKDATIALTIHPWQLQCPQCQRQWTSEDIFAKCTCGNELSTPIGGDELKLLSLDVDEP